MLLFIQLMFYHIFGIKKNNINDMAAFYSGPQPHLSSSRQSWKGEFMEKGCNFYQRMPSRSISTGADWPIGSSGGSRGPVAFGGPSVECSTSWAFWRILNFENPTRIGEVRALNCFNWIQKHFTESLRLFAIFWLDTFYKIFLFSNKLTGGNLDLWGPLKTQEYTLCGQMDDRP